MSVSETIREQVDEMPLDKVFTTRQFLGIGGRGAIDQALYLLVKSKKIIRLVRGVFIKAGSSLPSVMTVVKIKAESFGKKILDHGIVAARKLGLVDQQNDQNKFATTGRSSSFQFNGMTVRMVGVSPRKLHLADSVPGSVIRALWHLGNSQHTAALMEKHHGRWESTRRELTAAAPLMADWMTDIVVQPD